GGGVSTISTNTVPSTAAYKNGVVLNTSNIISAISASASNMTFTLSTGTLPTDPPSILSQPSSVTAAVGANVSFTVGADGGAPLFYRWRSNNVVLTGTNATNASYILNSITTNFAAQYTVVVSNGFGSLTSAPATL